MPLCLSALLPPPPLPWRATACSVVLDSLPIFDAERAPLADRLFWWLDLITVQIFAADYLLR